MRSPLPIAPGGHSVRRSVGVLMAPNAAPTHTSATLIVDHAVVDSSVGRRIVGDGRAEALLAGFCGLVQRGGGRRGTTEPIHECDEIVTANVRHEYICLDEVMWNRSEAEMAAPSALSGS